MDKVKVILGYVQKYHFWLLSVVAILLGLFGWMKARGALDEEYAKNKSTVTGKFSALSGIQQNQNPPNSQWATAIAAITKQEQKEVASTWQSLYDAQKKVLVWPEVMPSDFRSFIENSPPTAEIPQQWLAAYQTEVLGSEFPKLAKIVDAAPLELESKSSGGRPPAGSPTSSAATPANAASANDAPAVQYKVQWENQDAVYKSLAFPGGAPPTSFQVRLRQEDYWVYQALLNIIRATNAPAPYVPWIKRIEGLAIGAETADDFAAGMGKGKIMTLATAEGAAEAAAAAVAVDAGSGDPTQAPPPDQGRYLAADGTILPVGTSQEQQFKRLPIYMKLLMDQREITRLLTECANYPLPVEVRQLRINPGGGGGTQPGAGGAARTTAPAPGEAFDVTVEIHGIIYLFNPPDPVKLGAEAPAAAAAPAEG